MNKLTIHYDEMCPCCGGSGTVKSNDTVHDNNTTVNMCLACLGTGLILPVCRYCNGTGLILSNAYTAQEGIGLVREICQECGGIGRTVPSVISIPSPADRLSGVAKAVLSAWHIDGLDISNHPNLVRALEDIERAVVNTMKR